MSKTAERVQAAVKAINAIADDASLTETEWRTAMNDIVDHLDDVLEAAEHANPEWWAEFGDDPDAGVDDFGGRA